MFCELILQHPSDHIMANTWRLIFECKSEPRRGQVQTLFAESPLGLEELLTEYRLIGLALSDVHAQRQYD